MVAAAISFRELIAKVRAGEAGAAQELVERYEPAIRRAVRFRLAGSRLARFLDSLDICQSVLASFFVGASDGRYDIVEPEQLLKLLVAMARNKLACQSRAQHRQRRDVRRIEAAGTLNFGQFASDDPTPSQIVADEELIRDAERLFSDEERQLLALRKEGLEWAAIAERVGGAAEARRKQLARAVDRVARQLHLDDYGHE
jgi:DNA-directed RNA polymerase specialized sigma24 family protein